MPHGKAQDSGLFLRMEEQMNELVINGEVYRFHFGFGFIRKIGGAVKVPVTGIPGVTKDAGLYLAIANVYDGDILELVHVLDVANEGQTPRIKRAELEAWLEDESTDVEEVFKQVLDFFERANCCRKTMENVKEVARMQEKSRQT